MPRLMQVIEGFEVRGRGVEGDPFRHVPAYYTVDGELLATAYDGFEHFATVQTASGATQVWYRGRRYIEDPEQPK